MNTATKQVWYQTPEMLEHKTSAEGTTTEVKSNGRGYLLYEPTDPLPVKVFQENLDECVSPRFTEFRELLAAAITESSVLLEGAPGAGKSNICQDLERCSRRIGIPVLKISMHINAGTARHTEETIDLLRAYREKASSDVRRFFILDNVDYGGYKGSSRTRKNAMQYAEAVLPELTEAVDDTDLIAIGTAHDEEWRRSKWTWDDPAIDRPAKDLIDAYRSRYDFQGYMSEASIVELLVHRNANLEQAEKIARSLGEAGLLSFFYGNHIQPDTYDDSPQRAIAEVHAGREQRYVNAK